MADSIRLDDGPWRRLPWSLPGGALLTLLALLGLVRLLAEAPQERSKPPALNAQLLELPAPGPAASTAAAPPAPEVPAPPPALASPKPPTEALPPRHHPQRPPTPVPTQSESSAPSSATSSATASPEAAVQPSAGSPSLAGGRMSARALYQPLPEIPEELRRQNLEAVAVARFRVAADGSAQVELVRATNDTRLNQALLSGLARWRFFPAMEQGRPVASELEIRVPISVH